MAEEHRAELDRFRQLLARHDQVLVVGHKDADGDTLGCSLAFAEALRMRGKLVHVVIPPPLPSKYSWLPGFAQIQEQPPPDANSLVLFLDNGSLQRAGTVMEHVRGDATIVNIDHHTSNSRYGHLNIIDPDASAVGQMCLDMFEEFGWEVTPTMATNLYTALLTDTGGFRHENTTARALGDAATLAELGADPSRIAAMVYKSRPLTTLKLDGLTISGMQVEMDGRLAWAKVTRRLLRQAGAVMAESEGIIDTINSLAGLQVAMLFKEVARRLTKVSVRAREPVDAAVLCARFGGGGHPRAAAAEIQLPIEETIGVVLQAAREAIEVEEASALNGSVRRLADDAEGNVDASGSS
jgi:phosphoesterase RecJ-like protein